MSAFTIKSVSFELMRRLLAVTLLCAGFDTGRATRVDRPLEAMLPVAAGGFIMGASAEQQTAALRLCLDAMTPRLQKACGPDVFATEGPAYQVYLSAYAIDRVEVTVEAYRGCVRAGVCSPAPLLGTDPRFLQPRLPITSVTWDEARRFCTWRGARLPTEAEWERAARGTDGRTWPWGNLWRNDGANHGRFTGADELGPSQNLRMRPDDSDGWAFLAPVGSYPDALSPVGALDMAGNASEWTADVYHEDPPQRMSTVNPHGPAVGSLRTVRGGSWRHPVLFLRTTTREAVAADARSPEIGFRCAR
jgi:formylglycine-generating enzyme required for sulfatase activity